MTLAGQRFWAEREARIGLPIEVCPCCERPLPAKGAIDEIAIDKACSVYGITLAALTGPSKVRQFTAARALVVWALRSIGDRLSYQDIGTLLGGRHQSSVVNLHQKAISMRLRDHTFAAACDEIAAKLQDKEQAHGVN